jgi:hypothetical protein
LINPPSYTKLGDGGVALPEDAISWSMVRDNVTELIWEVKQNADGVQDYNNPNDADNTYTWYDSNPETNGGDAGSWNDGKNTEEFISALNAANYGGFNDWRMPSVLELQHIVSYGHYDPAIDTTFFPGTRSSSYWSATPRANGTINGWRVFFGNGSVSNNYKSDSYLVRAVRGGQFDSSFVDNGDGTVTDMATGLMWQQATDGQGTWINALSYCEGLELGGYTDWRLPTPKELLSIVDFSRHFPAINTTFFPGTQLSPYWSATTLAHSTSHGRQVIFSYGHVDSGFKSASYDLRAVRGGQNRLLDHLVIFSPVQGSTWLCSQTMPITWDTAGLGGTVEISLSRDGGKTFTLLDTAENSGDYSWVVTGPESVNCVLKLTPLDDPSKETSQSLFSIIGGGSLTVTISPQGAIGKGAKWRIDGGEWQDSGSTLPGLPVGDYEVQFKEIEGWDAPENQTISIEDEQTTSITGIYVQLPGCFIKFLK